MTTRTRIVAHCDTSEVIEAIQLAKKITGLGYQDIVKASGYDSIPLTRDTSPLKLRNAIYGVIYIESLNAHRLYAKIQEGQ